MITAAMEWKLYTLQNRMVEIGNVNGQDYRWKGYDYNDVQEWIDLAHDQFPGTDWERILTAANDIWKNLPNNYF